MRAGTQLAHIYISSPQTDSSCLPQAKKEGNAEVTQHIETALRAALEAKQARLWPLCCCACCSGVGAQWGLNSASVHINLCVPQLLPEVEHPQTQLPRGNLTCPCRMGRLCRPLCGPRSSCSTAC